MSTKYVDVTPTWSQIVPTLIHLIENSTSAGRECAFDELMRMAKLADMQVARIKAGEA